MPNDDDERPRPDDEALPTSLGGAPLPISALGEDGRDATDLMVIDPFAAPAITDVSLSSPFAPSAHDHTVAEGDHPHAETPTVAGAATVDARTSHDGVVAPSPSALGTALTLYDKELPSDDDERSHSLADASPIPEISQTGEPVPALHDDDPAPFLPNPHSERQVETTTRPVRRGRASGHAIPVEFMLGGYQAHRRLGVGGMAEVFLARPPGASRDVVLKRLMAHLSEDPRVSAMFRREARIASRLDHPNIVHILDFAEEQGSMFLVMEHLEGCDFRDLAYRWWAAARPLPIEPVVELIAQVARGLDYAHHAERATERPGLVHRDISPENLFLTREGVAKILDFGIAKPEGESDHLTKTGEVKGKIPYMSPEQVRGAPVDGRSDLWSLTVVLYWMLTGHRPFDGPNDFMTIKQIMEVEPVPPAAVNDLVPTALDDVVLRGLAKDPDRRFARGQELHDTLMSLLGQLGSRKDPVRFAGEVRELEVPPSEPVPYHPAAVPFARWPTPDPRLRTAMSGAAMPGAAMPFARRCLDPHGHCRAILAAVILAGALLSAPAPAAPRPPLVEQEHARAPFAAVHLEKLAPSLRADLFQRAVAPAHLTRGERSTVLVRFTTAPAASTLEALEDSDVRFTRGPAGPPLIIGRLAEAQVTARGLQVLTESPAVLDVAKALPTDVVPPWRENPFDRVLELIEVNHVWPLDDDTGRPLRGGGVTLADLDTGIDVFHPMLFRADGDLFTWVDANGDGTFTPGVDGVDLDQSGELDPSEVLHTLGGHIYELDGSLSHPVSAVEFDPGRSWLYADQDLSGDREAGALYGFTDDDPAFGEPLFLADDLDQDGVLGPLEKVRQLKTSKLKAIHQPLTGTSWIRGVNLSEYPAYLELERGHGCGVAGLLVGGEPGRTLIHGVAPDADLVMLDQTVPPGFDPQNVDYFESILNATFFASTQGVKVLVHEYGVRLAEFDDGSSPHEELLDDLSEGGMVQATATHNFANNGGDARIALLPGESETVTIEVYNDGFYAALRLSVEFRWANATAGAYPEMVLTAPDGEPHPLALDNYDGRLYSLTIAKTSPRDTGLVTSNIYELNEDGTEPLPITGGEWTLTLTNPTTETLDGFFTVSDESHYSYYTLITSHPGTDETTMAWPSTADSAISVGASVGNRIDDPREQDLGIRPFSGRGPRIDGALGVDVVAPSDHYTSAPESPYAPASLFRFGGTSGALPQVAGAIALLLQKEPELTPSEVKTRLHEAGNDAATGPLPNRHWGYGRLDVYRLLVGEDAPENTPPTASASGPAAAGLQQPLSLDASATVDDEDPLDTLTFRWDVGYDGSWDIETSGPVVELVLADHGVSAPGPVLVVLEARDPFGAAGQTVIELIAEDLPDLPDTPPGCGCDAQGRSGASPLLVLTPLLALAVRRARRRT